jgi:hypothetical protein
MFDALDIFSFEEVEASLLNDRQAAAIGRLAVEFNMLELCVGYALEHLIDPERAVEIRVLIDRQTYGEKVDRLERLVKLIESSIREPGVWARLTTTEQTWAERNFSNGRTLLGRLRAANKFRNGLVHCRVAAGAKSGANAVLESPRAEVTSDPDLIEREARRNGALAVSTLMFGQQLYGTSLNGKRARRESLSPA